MDNKNKHINTDLNELHLTDEQIFNLANELETEIPTKWSSHLISCIHCQNRIAEERAFGTQFSDVLMNVPKVELGKGILERVQKSNKLSVYLSRDTLYLGILVILMSLFLTLSYLGEFTKINIPGNAFIAPVLGATVVITFISYWLKRQSIKKLKSGT